MKIEISKRVAIDINNLKIKIEESISIKFKFPKNKNTILKYINNLLDQFIKYF